MDLVEGCCYRFFTGFTVSTHWYQIAERTPAKPQSDIRPSMNHTNSFIRIPRCRFMTPLTGGKLVAGTSVQVMGSNSWTSCAGTSASPAARIWAITISATWRSTRRAEGPERSTGDDGSTGRWWMLCEFHCVHHRFTLVDGFVGNIEELWCFAA